ncbi:crossover junction endodeoxyribonuclease RuvC [uncultured Propionibacterium sp.]|uniref:crossover junction endodeoxyribonuclease RuvC n=1 Tax=uncultured Propionibacterium sp. TaxID=218066 RepID=UPI00292DFE2E|nr:crossover junction endodeoxyribonuclease RuvC [uncultured Propionibacterium sp.]
MGVDPGLTRCGVAVVEGRPGARPALIAAGVVRTGPDMPHEYRLLRLEEGLTEWYDGYRPEALSIERVFAQHNLHSVTGISQAAGIAMLIGARHATPVELHTPSEAKAAVTGSGHADKKQVGTMVARILGLAEPPRPIDAADAVALAITQLWRGEVENKYAQAVAAARRKVS